MAGAPKGNKNAARGSEWRDAVRKEVKRGDNLNLLAKKLISMAAEGDIQAIKEVGDRLDGKPVQAIGNDGDNELIIRFTV